MTTTTTIDTSTSISHSSAALAETVANMNPSVNKDGASNHVYPLAASLPTTITRSYKIVGVPTHAFCQVFGDRIVLGVTQLQSKMINAPSGHIGSWVYCQASQSPIDPRQVEYELSTVLGGGGSNQSLQNKASHRDEKEVYARRIAERLLEKQSIPGGTDRIVILLGISLLSTESSASSIRRFKVLVEVLVELIERAVQVALGS